MLYYVFFCLFVLQPVLLRCYGMNGDFFWSFTHKEINKATAVPQTSCLYCGWRDAQFAGIWHNLQKWLRLQTRSHSYFSSQFKKKKYHNYFAYIWFIYPYWVTKSEQFSSAALSSTGTYHGGACTDNEYHTCTLSLASAARRVILGRKKKNHYMRRMKCRTQRRVCSCVHTRRNTSRRLGARVHSFNLRSSLLKYFVWVFLSLRSPRRCKTAVVWKNKPERKKKKMNKPYNYFRNQHRFSTASAPFLTTEIAHLQLNFFFLFIFIKDLATTA